VNPHLERIPGLATFTARRLPCRDLELLRGQTDRALDAEILGFGAVDKLGADLFEGLHLGGGERDADLVDFLFMSAVSMTIANKHIVRRDERDPRQSPSRLFGKTFSRIGDSNQNARSGNVMIGTLEVVVVV
jgi:hypothetical protein